MKILPIIQSLFESLLLEANLLNAKDPYNGVSLTAFLDQFTAGMNTTSARQMFIKKLSRLLMSDERFLYTVRELPDTAPPWAQQAMEQGDLVYFNPSDDLKDQIENLSHYVASLEQDLVSSDANIKATAAREMQGFPKAETLDLLLSKVQEYFSRGVEKAEASETEGMRAVLEAPGGYVWYKLETPKAFYREGQTLSNCIGRNYTAENTKATNTVIYVLRDRSNSSVAATRIMGGVMQEVKCKGNTPPLPRYMPAVQKLINTFNITLAQGGRSDVGNSGYYYFNGVLYSKPQAIAKLITVKKLFDIPGTKIHVSQVVSELQELVAELYTDNSYYSRQGGFTVYQAQMDDNDPLVAIVVIDNKLTSITRLHKTGVVKEAEEPQQPTNAILPTMISMLAKAGKIATIQNSVVRELFFHDGALWNETTKEFTYRSESVAHQHKPKQKGSHTLDVYEGPAAQQMYSQLTDDRPSDVEEVKTVYATVVRKASEEVGKETDKVLIVVEFKNGSTALYSVRGNDVDFSQAGYTRHGSRWSADLLRDGKTVTTLVALANEQGFKLPQRFQVAHGLSYREGQYINLPELTPTEIPGDPSASIFDLSTLDPMDKATVLARAVSMNDTKPHMTPFTDKFKFVGVTSGLDKVLTGNADNQYFYSSTRGRDRDHAKSTKEAIQKWTNEVFGSAAPTAVYRITIKYGADKGGKVSMVAAGKKVVAIDTETLEHTWQSRDDYQKVCDQLNKFAADHKLRFDRSSVKKSPQLRVSRDGDIVPAEALAKSRLETRLSRDKSVTSRVGEVPFSDETVAKKMSHDDFGTWSAHGIEKGVAGTPWEISDGDGNVVGIFSVSKEGKIGSMYSNPSGVPGSGRTIEVNGRDLPIIKTVNTKVLPYVKTLAAEFGWKESDTTASLTPHSSAGRLMRQALKRRSHTVGISRDRNTAPAGEQRYIQGKKYYKDLQTLKTAGLVRIRDGEPNDYYDYMTLTDAGRSAALQLQRGDDVSWASTSAGAAELSDRYQPPTAPAPVERAPREAHPDAGERRARVPMEGGGSKADRALQRFRELADANDGTLPTRSEFIALLQQPPFNMTPAGASTYQYNIKAKYLRERGELNEHFTFIDFLTQIL